MTPVSPPATVRRRARAMLGKTRRTALEWLAGLCLLTQGPHTDGRSLVVLGDSHAVLLVEGIMPSRRVVRAGRGTTLVYLGPRLMHSVAREGLPSWALRLLQTWGRSPLARGAPTVAVLLGEIDLRCHLGKPGRSDHTALVDLVDGFVARARDLLERLGRDGHVVVCGPNPPSESYASDAAFPVVGNVDERVAILDRLCTVLSTTISAVGDSRLRFLDVRPFVAGADGHLCQELTFDGCHLNAAGAALVRAGLTRMEAG